MTGQGSAGAIDTQFIVVNGLRLHVAVAGPEDGQPVILLHGFPDAWFGWTAQIQALAAAGFRVLAPDQRGYNLSDKPEGIAHYRLDLLAADIVALADRLGIEHFCLAGHDFGALVSWRLAMTFPDRLKRLAIANVPHPAVAQQVPFRYPAQLIKSWYVFFFQLPGLPERALARDNWRPLVSQMSATLSPDQLDRYREAWSRPGAMKSMINWYRALPGALLSRPATWPGIDVPVLVIWGRRCPYLSYSLVQPSLDRCHDGRLFTFQDAGHWVQRDRPDEVNELLIEHFSS